MIIRSAADYITPLINAADTAINSSISVQSTKRALSSCYQKIDTLEHTSKKIATGCFAIFAFLGTTAGAVLVGIEASVRTIKEIGASARLHQIPIKIAACFSAILFAPGISIAYASFSIATILDESIKRFQEQAPLPQGMKEAAAL